MLELLTHVFTMSRPCGAALALVAAALVLAIVRARRGRLLEPQALGLSAAILAVAAVVAFASHAAYETYLRRLGRNLPHVTLLEPVPDTAVGDTITLRAHATDKPGELGPIAAVRRVEFWLYHPSFVEQHAGNHESKVLLGQVDGPLRSDEYALTWTCSNPFTPARDGDHGGGAGTRTYSLPDDGRPYSVQAHALDDEFFAHPKMPAKSQRVPIRFKPCRMALAARAAAGTPPPAQEPGDWRADWEVADGFALSIDSEGFHFPTAIAFVPDPGPNPGDPLYFVTELRGAVKVVTRDRTVHTFAQGFFHLKPEAELPDYRGETGLAAICLDAKSGFVFVSFAEQDDRGVLRNAIVRFETTPRTFSLTPKASTRIAPVLGTEVSSRAHQVGPMVVHDGALYVAVGDALRAGHSHDIGVPLGKILRMTLDGEPLPDNPYAARPAAAGVAARDYVWASGLRNPFGLALADGRLLATDNGPGVDRLVAVERGRDYGYDGTDWSMGTNALAVFAPSVGPAQMAWLARDEELLGPEYRGALFLAFAGSTQAKPGPGLRGEKSVVALGLDPAAGRVVGAARPILRYRGADRQLPVGLAFGPDALYVAPLLNVRGSSGAILRLRYAPSEAHPFVIDNASPVSMLSSLGCMGCHAAYEGRASPVPSLDARRVVEDARARLSAPDYARAVAAADAAATWPQEDLREARREISDAHGKEQVRLWLKYRIFEPRFADPAALMPKQEVSLTQADKLAEYFVTLGWTGSEAGPHDSPSRRAAITEALPKPHYRHVAAALAVGAIAGLAAGRRMRRRA